MDKFSKFDENFLEGGKSTSNTHSTDIDVIVKEAQESNICLKEKNTFISCTKDKHGYCSQLKESFIICMKNRGKLV
jgi:hypothetical protein